MFIKPMDDRQADIAEMQAIAEISKELGLRKEARIYGDIKKIGMGARAEKNAAHHIERHIYNPKKQSSTIVAHDLRLDIDGQAAQIDHVTLNDIGVVRLFETKTYSTGIKVTEEGDFLRWDEKRQRYQEIPSPIEQSRRHADVLRAALASIGYSAVFIDHYIVIDYQAKLIKPDKHFSHICRPDKIGQAINGRINETSSIIPSAKDLISVGKGLPRLLGGALQDEGYGGVR